jgi:hypothetical protein
MPEKSRASGLPAVMRIRTIFVRIRSPTSGSATLITRIFITGIAGTEYDQVLVGLSALDQDI